MTLDEFVFTVTMGCGCFAGGLWYGEAKPVPPVAKVCPTLEGHKVLSSSHTVEGHYCTYAISKGRALRQVKI
jgi:hypothetical protein